MTLTEYFKKIPLGLRIKEKERIAETLGLTLRHIYSLETGARSIRPHMLIKIEQATKGSVKRHELMPELYAGYRRIIK